MTPSSSEPRLHVGELEVLESDTGVELVRGPGGDELAVPAVAGDAERRELGIEAH